MPRQATGPGTSGHPFWVTRDAGQEFFGLRWGDPDAPAILLHHATGMCAAIWRVIALALAQDFQVFAFDARGHGMSPKEVEPVSWKIFSEDLCQIAEAIAEKFEIQQFRGGVGHSLGGVAMLHAAVLAPQRFASLCLLDPALIPPPAQASRNAMSIRTRLRKSRFSSREVAVSELKEQYSEWDPQVVEDFVGGGLVEKQGGVELLCEPQLEATIYELGATEVLNELAGLKAETLILSAAQWRFGPGHRSAKSQTERIRVESVEMGHGFPMENPTVVVNACRRWFG